MRSFDIVPVLSCPLISIVLEQPNAVDASALIRFTLCICLPLNRRHGANALAHLTRLRPPDERSALVPSTAESKRRARAGGGTGAGFAAMPCCIREGLYSSVHHVKHIGIHPVDGHLHALAGFARVSKKQEP
jgi:hypothetical protein